VITLWLSDIFCQALFGHHDEIAALVNTLTIVTKKMATRESDAIDGYADSA
jgi:hypothetical protein